MKQKALIITMTVISIILVACSSPAEPTATPTDEPAVEAEASKTLVLGDIDEDDPISKIEELSPLASYFADGLSEFGIGSGEVKIAPDLETMIDMVETGEIDIFYDSLYPAMIIANETGAKPLLRGWRGGEPVYRSVFFTTADSGITSLDDLNGKMIAYDDPASTSGYMVPTAYLVSNGLNPDEKNSHTSSVADDEVGYVFSNDDENTIEWVMSGQVDVGVVDNLTYMEDIPEETREQLVIIAETDDVPRRVLMIGPDIDEEMASALASMAQSMDTTEEGQALLAIVKTAKFDEFPGGVDEVFDPIQEMFDIINDR